MEVITMRIVYDDTMQKEVCEIIHDAMIHLNKRIDLAVRWEYGMNRVQRVKVKERINGILEDYHMEIGNTVIHAHGIGNNCQYPVYYYADNNEIQHCANININSGLYGEVYVSVEDYNGRVVSKKYKLTQHGVTTNY
jgi:hypothetical protein